MKLIIEQQLQGTSSAQVQLQHQTEHDEDFVLCLNWDSFHP